jgi:hypothetical protein
MYFPQGPPPVQNQRLQSVCNMMWSTMEISYCIML